MTDSRQAEREQQAREALGSHYTCEDGWYSCPLSEEGCCDDAVPKDKCTCGLDTNVQRVAALLEVTEAAVRKETWGKADAALTALDDILRRVIQDQLPKSKVLAMIEGVHRVFCQQAQEGRS
jgi:hypothetical protein